MPAGSRVVNKVHQLAKEVSVKKNLQKKNERRRNRGPISYTENMHPLKSELLVWIYIEIY